MNNRTAYLPYIALAAVCIIWGTTYLALRVAVLHFPPFLFTAIRQCSAGLLLLGIMAVASPAKLPSVKQLARLAVAGFFMITLGNGLVAWAEMHISSGMAAILCSTMPAMVIIINLSIHREEKPTLPIVAGVFLGLAGITIIFGEHITEFSKTEYLLGIIMTLLAVVSWAFGSLWIKKQSTDFNPFVSAGFQMIFGGLLALPLSVVFDDLQTVQWTTEFFYPLLYLIVFGSVIAYASYLYALRKLSMTIVSLYAYVNPLVAVVLGWLLLDEKLNGIIGIGILTTIGGIYLVNRKNRYKNLGEA
ncbi:MAG: EamA family transporter [Cyclobacteriaceae bacterium]|nr:EamA family transporter [Cyclobacteriaceae bacterium]